MAKFKCGNCNSEIEAFANQPVVECTRCGKKYKNPVYVAPTNNVPQTNAVASVSIQTVVPETVCAVGAKGCSEFTGTVISMIGHRLFNALLMLITLTFAYPWVLCRGYKWEIGHKKIDGYQLTFDGKGSSLIGHWICWVLLALVTLGIYSLWIPIKVQKWITEHTHIDFAA